MAFLELFILTRVLADMASIVKYQIEFCPLFRDLKGQFAIGKSGGREGVPRHRQCLFQRRRERLVAQLRRLAASGIDVTAVPHPYQRKTAGCCQPAVLNFIRRLIPSRLRQPHRRRVVTPRGLRPV